MTVMVQTGKREMGLKLSVNKKPSLGQSVKKKKIIEFSQFYS